MPLDGYIYILFLYYCMEEDFWYRVFLFSGQCKTFSKYLNRDIWNLRLFFVIKKHCLKVHSLLHLTCYKLNLYSVFGSKVTFSN